MDLKTQRPLSRPSYGSFNPRAASTSLSSKNSNSSSNSSSFYIPQSIPEHQLVSQFTSPGAPSSSDFRRGLVDEYVEGPRTAFARTRALLQRSGNTHTALKQLLQTDQRRDVGPALSTSNLTSRLSSTQSGSDGGLQQLQPLLLKPQARQEPNPQEDSDEHNYWIQELARRRAGLKRSRRRTCSSAGTTTSPLRVGVVMCSVPLVLVLGFVVFVVLFGQALDVSGSSSNSNSRYRVDSGMMKLQEDLREAGGEARGSAAGMKTKGTSESVALVEEISPGENEGVGLKLLDVPTDQSRLRGVQMDGVVQ
uniref:Uncharacterized protein n=1 Tax=Hyaloperonospora arabidopsidis (strain Emoy2) TaxID=559515 RepID=M4B7I1_HYAAE